MGRTPARKQRTASLRLIWPVIACSSRATGSKRLRHWVPIYIQRPQYLGGQLIQQLYTIYLALGDRAAQQEQPITAVDWYNQAALLPVADDSALVARLPRPRPTPTPTSMPTSTPVPVVVVAPLPPPVPTATPAQHRRVWQPFKAGSPFAATATAMPPSISCRQMAANSSARRMM